MGITDILFRSNTRIIKEYDFTYIADNIESPHLAKTLKESLDRTKCFSWNPKDFFWHTFDNDSDNPAKSSIAFNAKFQTEYGTGHRVYIDPADNLNFGFTVNKPGNELGLTLMDDSGNILVNIAILLDEE